MTGAAIAGFCAVLLGFAAERASPFRAPVSLAMGANRQPSCLASGDFNGDGRPDLAVGSSGTNDVTVFLGDGRGGLTKGASIPAGANPMEIFPGDLDRDGHLDLAIANHETSFVTILEGDGRGGFLPAPETPLTVHSKPHPHTIDGCDVDGDGWIDLVIDDWGENRLTLLLADQKGGFRGPGAPIEVGRKPYRNLRVKDLDGDGRCDIVAPSYGQGVVTVLRGDGRGHFRAMAPIPAGPAPFTVGIADLNRDGRPDLVLENYSGHITDPSDDALTFLLGDGKGGFRLGPRLPTGRAPFDVAVGDIDGDGFADAATADFGGADVTLAFGGPDGLSPSRTMRVPIGRRPSRVLLVDFNGDGKADAITANEEDRDVTVLLTK